LRQNLVNDNNKHAFCLSNVAILRAKARRELTKGVQNNILYIINRVEKTYNRREKDRDNL